MSLSMKNEHETCQQSALGLSDFLSGLDNAYQPELQWHDPSRFESGW